MDFDWQGMLDFVVGSEVQHAIVKAQQTPSPIPEDDQSRWSFYGPAFTEAVIIPQNTCETDGNSMPVYASLETFGSIPTSDSYVDLTLADSVHHEYYAGGDCSTFQNETIIDITSDSSQDCPTGADGAVCSTFEIEPVIDVPSNSVQDYPTEPEVYEVPYQQVVPQQHEPASNSVAFPIRIEVMGYVGQDPVKPASKSSKKKSKNKTTKKLKKFTSEWNCEPCGRSFKSRGGLLQHNTQIHSGPTPHGCDICGKRYRDFDSMQQHRQRHLMKDKPFKCEECPKQFIRHSDLLRHVNLHHRESRHRCGYCGKAFDRADHLTDHVLSHQNGTVKKRRGSVLNLTIN